MCVCVCVCVCVWGGGGGGYDNRNVSNILVDIKIILSDFPVV